MTDILTSVKSVLDDNWQPASTGNRTPTVSPIFDNKRLDFRISGSKDHILLYEITRVPEDNAAGVSTKRITWVIAVDIRTMLTRVQADLIRVEVRRILNSKQLDPFGDQTFDISDITDDQDLSDKSVGIWRFQIKWELKQLNVTL